jgi:hypothetical protein
LILLLFALLLVPAVVFAEGEEGASDEVPSAGDQASGPGETIAPAPSGSTDGFDQDPAAGLSADFDGNDPGNLETGAGDSEDIDLVSGQEPASLEVPGTSAGDTPFDEAEATEFTGPEDEGQECADSGSSSDREGENPSTPLYFKVEQVSMSPLLNPGNIIELVSAEYGDGDLVVAQLASGTYVVKVLEGDKLVPLGAGVSYSASDLTILGRAALSTLTAGELEAGGLSWGSVLGASGILPIAGDGSSGNPYQIATLENLYWIAENSSRWSLHYKQTADLDASSTNSGSGWSPIGNETTKFTGTYDGGGYTINSLYINRGLLAAGQIAEAQALLDAIAAVIGSFST